MLPVRLTAKINQLCATGLNGFANPASASYAIAVHTGATLPREPATQAGAEATARELITLGTGFTAGLPEIAGRDFASYGVTPASVFNACARSHDV